MRPSIWRALLIAQVVSICACAVRPPVPEPVGACADLFARLDAEAESAGVQDGGSARIEGFPYLRLNRFLASFGLPVAEDQRRAWLQHARALDLAARQVELSHLLAPPEATQALEQVTTCGGRWLQADLQSPARLTSLRERVQVRDDYSQLARALGAYPLALPFMAAGIRGFRAGVAADYALPLAQLQAQGDWQLWEVEAGFAGVDESQDAFDSDWAGMTNKRWSLDALGVPELDAAQWQALFARHAPAFLLASDAAADRPGQPFRHADGRLGWRARPVMYQHAGFARFYDQVLVQLSYLIWFPERTAKSRFDPYAGPLDGVIWRVSLDQQGRPLAYDTVHACGCYHYVYPAQQLRRRPGQAWQELAVQPQGQLPWQRLAVVLGAGDHYVRRVLPLHQARQWAAGRHGLTALDYADVLREDDSAPLFDADGLVRGSERAERYWLWPTGVVSPGAMRQWGRHATAFIGRAHFDDARLMETWFLPP